MANKREQIRAAIAAAREAIDGASPYHYSWAGKVDQWRVTTIAQEEGMRVNIVDRNPQPSEEFVGGWANQWLRYVDVDLQITNGDSGLTQDESLDAQEDIERVVGANKHWSTLAHTSEWRGTEEEKTQDERAIFRATITVRVFYLTAEWAAE